MAFLLFGLTDIIWCTPKLAHASTTVRRDNKAQLTLPQQRGYRTPDWRKSQFPSRAGRFFISPESDKPLRDEGCFETEDFVEAESDLPALTMGTLLAGTYFVSLRGYIRRPFLIVELKVRQLFPAVEAARLETSAWTKRCAL